MTNEIVTWQLSYSVNIPLIDSQHMELINLTNRLYRSCMNGRGHSKDAFMEVLRGAVDYVGYHFSTEEKVMERVAYPGFAAHKQEHNAFVRDVLKTEGDLSKGINNNPLAFVTYLKDWVLSHIAVSDKALGQYLVELRQSGRLQDIALKIKRVNNRFVFE